MLAAHEALDRGFRRRHPAQPRRHRRRGDGQNVFFVKDNELVTNDATSSILPGITRDTVLKLAAEAIFRRACAPSPRRAHGRDEVFLTGTAAEVTPVREIDGRGFRTEREPSGRGCKTLLAAVRGRDAKHAEWLTWLE